MKKRKGNFSFKIMAALLAVVLVVGGVMEISPSVVNAAGTVDVKIKITIVGYDGNDPTVLGAVTLKNLMTDEEWTDVTMDGNVIICEALGASPGTYQCMIDGIAFGYQTPCVADSSITMPYTFYAVHFINGTEVYETIYVSKTKFVNFKNTATAPAVPPEKEGYDFAGWVTAEGGSETFDFASPITEVTTIYASWTEKVEAPVITDYPEIIGCDSTANESVSVTATGKNLSYQWQINRNDGSGFVDISGETAATISVNKPQEEDDGHLYRCIVSNKAGRAETDGIELVVYDVRAKKAKEKIEEALEGMAVSNDTSEDDIRSLIDRALNSAGISRVDTTINDFKNTPAAGVTSGKVTGQIEVSCNGRRECVLIDKTIMGHVHSPGSEWKSNETSHWHECACGNRTDEAAHTEDSGTEVKAPTATEAGEKQFHCSVCGYLTRTESIPATGSGENPGEETGSGNGDTGGDAGGSTVPNASGTATGELHKEVAKGENAPETTISMSGTDLANVILTEEERQQAQNGLNIKIILTVTDAGDSVSEEDKMAAEGALGSYEMGQYLDISLFKVVGETQNRITETAGMIQITLAVPEGLKNTDSTKEREYTVIRVHNGETQVLADKDNDEDTITIETDRFSTYALAYKDSPAETGNEKDSEPKTGDGEPVRLYATLAMIAGFAYLLLYFADSAHGMTEKEKRELVERIIHWAHRGGRVRRLPALAAILLLLVYYHGIGKKAAVRWQKV